MWHYGKVTTDSEAFWGKVRPEEGEDGEGETLKWITWAVG